MEEIPSSWSSWYGKYPIIHGDPPYLTLYKMKNQVAL